MFHDPTFWFLVAFLIFIFGVGKKFWKFISGYLDQHGLKIEEKIKDAIRMREEAQALLGEVRKKHMDAQKQADEIIEHARLQVENFRKESQQELEHFLKSRERLAHDRIQHAETQALQDIRRQAIFVSTQACQDILKDGVGDQQHTELIDQAIADLKPGGSQKDLLVT
ncbi:MAG: F0F1 ATP synthase subunit B [Pseudomonadota bacterium]